MTGYSPGYINTRHCTEHVTHYKIINLKFEAKAWMYGQNVLNLILNSHDPHFF